MRLLMLFCLKLAWKQPNSVRGAAQLRSRLAWHRSMLRFKVILRLKTKVFRADAWLVTKYATIIKRSNGNGAQVRLSPLLLELMDQSGFLEEVRQKLGTVSSSM